MAEFWAPQAYRLLDLLDLDLGQMGEHIHIVIITAGHERPQPPGYESVFVTRCGPQILDRVLLTQHE